MDTEGSGGRIPRHEGRCSPYPQSPTRGGPPSYKNHYCHHYYCCYNKYSQFPLECFRALLLGPKIFSTKISKVTLLQDYTLQSYSSFAYCPDHVHYDSCPLPPWWGTNQDSAWHLAVTSLVSCNLEVARSWSVPLFFPLQPCFPAPSHGEKTEKNKSSCAKPSRGLQWGYLGTGLMPVPMRCLNGQGVLHWS